MDKKIDNSQKKIELGLYIHIPFCVKKCDYCDFLSAPAEEETKQRYFKALHTEIMSYKGRMSGYTVPTIFFGGGTPSCVNAAYISDIMETIGEVFNLDQSRMEATIEVNPGTLTRENLKVYKETGINRLSFGLQSADDKELMLLGRIHTFHQFKKNFLLAREIGFTNINVDLMSALPGQTLQSWEATLETVTNLKPEHISAYSLIIEEGTPFYDRYGKNTPKEEELPDEETDRLIYHKTKEILQGHGYLRYEISNYAKAGFESRHNSSYWIGTQYLGLGLGASSLLNSSRYKNTQDMDQYIEGCSKNDFTEICEEHVALTKQDQMEEFMFLGLRLCKGVNAKEFNERFGVTMDSIYESVFKKLLHDNLLYKKEDMVYLTDYGIDVSNQVLSQFLLD